MPNTALTQAIQEAYASAPAAVVILDTLELRHPDFGAPIRLVRDTQDWNLTLEADAPANPGQTVLFTAHAFDLDIPPVEDNALPEAVITMDNILPAVVQEIEAAVTSAEPIELTYRPYLSNDTGAPQMDPPLHLVFTTISANALQITARASYGDYTNRKFPNKEYTLTEYPGLVAAA